MNAHTGEKPYRGNQCEISFLQVGVPKQKEVPQKQQGHFRDNFLGKNIIL